MYECRAGTAMLDNDRLVNIMFILNTYLNFFLGLTSATEFVRLRGRVAWKRRLIVTRNIALILLSSTTRTMRAEMTKKTRKQEKKTMKIDEVN